MGSDDETTSNAVRRRSVVAVELNRTRYDKVVEALGGHGEHVVTADEIGPAIKRAFESGTALVNVEIRQDRGR